MIAQSKIDRSIALLKKAEKLALRYSNDGFYLAFSGGKDSQCIYELAKMGGVKFKAYYHCTTIEPPQLIHFVRNYYPDVIIEHPKTTMWKEIINQKMLPTMNIRYCCRIFKEGYGNGRVNILGVRRAESTKRAKRNEVELDGRRFSGSLDQFNRSYDGEMQDQCIGDNHKVMILPIIDWTDDDVWSFIRDVRHIHYCELYDNGYTRLGCILCPMATSKSKVRDMNNFPKYVEQYKRIISKMMADGNYSEFDSADDVFNWWIGKLSKKVYLENKKQLKLKFENE